jgi:hypothetical protein
MRSLLIPRRLLWNPAVEGILFALAWLAITNVTIYFIYVRAVEAVKEQIREGLLRNVSAAATVIDGDQHQMFTSKAVRNDPAYLSFIQRMERLRRASQDIRYAYTNILKDGKVYFIANGSPQNDNDKDGRPDEAPQLMDPYPDAGQALLESLRLHKPTVDREPYTDAWGTFYSAYAPFKDSKGRFVGTLGMDLELVTLKTRLVPIGIAAQRAAFTSGILAFLFGTAVWYFRSRNRILEEQRRKGLNRIGTLESERNQERTAAAIQLEAVASRIQESTASELIVAPAADQALTYATALRRYAIARQGLRSTHCENFDPAQQIRSALPTEIPVEVSSNVPSRLFGDPTEITEILRSICFNPFSNTILGSLQHVSLESSREQLNNLDLVITLQFCGAMQGRGSGGTLIQDPGHPEHVFDENSLQFATCCEQVRALGGSLSHLQDGEDVELVRLSLPFEKFRET